MTRMNDLNDPSDPNDLNDQNDLNDLNDLHYLNDPSDWMTGSFADDWPYGIFIICSKYFCIDIYLD